MATTNSNRLQNIQGNQACALAAVAAGCRFFAGYPITPSSEIAERMALELPVVGGIFIQMEDEIASMAAVIGASIGGVKSMTATSGPGFSLKQENLGYAAGAEIPCVVINVMRGGPSTGMPTRPAQGDVMQARWGTHGDHVTITLTPASVAEVHQQTVRAFNLSERFRVPVVLLIDEIIGHLTETVELPDTASLQLSERKWATGDQESFQPYSETEDRIPPMARPGDGFRTHTTGLTHGPSGFPTQEPELVDRVSRRLLEKLELHRNEIDSFETIECDDAQIIVVAYGITARAARRAVRLARERGIAAGLFRPITLWPFPEQQFREQVTGASAVLVPEMNAGQLSLEIERFCPDATKLKTLNRIDGEAISPAQILEQIEELASHG
jgi:2-oxoglutarate ferredoxin oxidoreductase subunit alpha